MITVFADKYLFKIKEIVPDSLDLRFYDPEVGLPDQIGEADALLVRTVTDVNEQTLSPIPPKLKFVATGSAGTDHVDQEYLKQHDIHFAHSAGCNARSVAEYVITALIIWSQKNKIDIKNESIGIIGVGHVGTALQQMLDQLGWDYHLYDPPRAEREDGFTSASQQEVLDSSILTFHTPLYNSESPHATRHWLDEEKLSGQNFRLVLNTSRGGVVDEQSLLKAMGTGQVDDMIIDVWEHEPSFRDEVARKAFIATPHIAGYSVQAKFRATKMIVDQMIESFGLDLAVPALNNSKEKIPFDVSDISDITLPEVINTVHPIGNYHRELLKLIDLPVDVKEKRFSRLRTDIAFRNEYAFIEIPQQLTERFPVLGKIGLKTF